jgi:hypothetical protein
MNSTTNTTGCAPYDLFCLTTEQAYNVLMDYILFGQYHVSQLVVDIPITPENLLLINSQGKSW